MSNLRYYIAIAIAVFVFLMYWFKEDPSIYYERSVQDLSKIQLGKELAIKGRGEIKACISCHTQDITNSNYPRLAGLNPVYIKKQLKDFAKDKKTSGARYDEVMSPIAKAMNKDDIQNLAAYYSTLPFTVKAKEIDTLTKERAQELAHRGRAKLMLPRCEACHGANGEGFRELFPPLAGQSEAYLIEQINRWQNAQRDNDPLSMMKNIADRLSEEDKIIISRYYSSLPFSINEER